MKSGIERKRGNKNRFIGLPRNGFLFGAQKTKDSVRILRKVRGGRREGKIRRRGRGGGKGPISSKLAALGV